MSLDHRTKGMTRAERREYVRDCKVHLSRENKGWPDSLVRFPSALTGPKPMPYAVMRSKGFMVQFYMEPGTTVRLSIHRTTIDDTGEWVDGITWDDLQRIKREAGFGDCCAIEIYPPDADVVNVASIRHLWVLPEAHPLMWRDGK